MRQQEAEQLRQQKEENLKKMAKWKQDNERNMAAREDLKQQELLRDQEMIVKARQVADEAERKRLKELEILKAKMKVFAHFSLCAHCSLHTPASSTVGYIDSFAVGRCGINS